MHAYFLTRGIQHQIDLWRKYMETRQYPLKVKDTNTGEEKKIWTQGGLRPIQLWEYVFPKTSKDAVLNTMGFGKGIHPDTTKMKLGVAALRKALGAEKVKKEDYDDSKKIIMPDFDMSIVPIGIREDEDRVDEQGMEYEGL